MVLSIQDYEFIFLPIKFITCINTSAGTDKSFNKNLVILSVASNMSVTHIL